MNKVKLIFSLFLFLTVVCLIFLVWKDLSIENYESVNKKFQEDKDIIFVVSKYLEKSHHNKIYIPSSMKAGTMSAEGTNQDIVEPEITQAIEVLKSKGYSVIGKSRNTIFFQRESNLDGGRGIAYSIDGQELQLEFLTMSKPLLENNWYYYEEDYNEWENNNFTNGIPNYLLGEWNIQYAKTRDVGETGKEYPLGDLYSEETLRNGVKMVFNSDGTFVRTIGDNLSGTTTMGTYILRYENKVLLKHKDGTQSTVKYLIETGEIVYYTMDSRLNSIDEYYKKTQE